MSNQLKKKYDIIINGGGIVGFTLLNLIQKSPHLNRFKVLLIEQGAKPKSFKQPPRIVDKVDNLNAATESDKKFSNRVSSITPSSRMAFERLGVWDSVREFAKDITDIKVWNYDYSNKIIFQQTDSSSWRNKVVFTVVENNRLSTALLDNIYKHPGKGQAITWSTSLQSMSGASDFKLIDISARNNETNENHDASANLILGCDGYKSKVRDLAQIKYTERDLNKTAVVGTVKMDSMSRGPSGSNSIAYQRFSNSKDTVAAILPLDNEYSSFVISAPNDYAKFLLECDNETFTAKFNRLLCDEEMPQNPVFNTLHGISNTACDAIRSNLRAILATSGIQMNSAASSGLVSVPRLESVVDNSRAMFPLIFGWTSPKMTAKLPGRQQAQVALLGDASHRVHPLAGQGLNLGIQDAIELVKQLETFAKSGEDISNDVAVARALKRFECHRQTYIIPMSLGIFSMQQLFKLLPSSAVTGINNCDFIKTSSVKFANGGC